MQPRYDHDYDFYQRPQGRLTPRSTRRYDPYVYDRWSEQRPGQSHNYSLPIPIHEPETANGHGRKRINMACARCRRRKIKCSGDPKDGTGCNACRTAGADLNNCVFTRVGTDRQFEFIPMPEYIPQTQLATYGSLDGAGRSFSTHPMSWRDAPAPPYPYDHRTSFPPTSLSQFTLDVVDSIPVPVAPSVSDGSSFGSVWSHDSERTNTSVTTLGGYYDGASVVSYESMYPLQRTTSNTSDQYSPLNLTPIHSTLPPPPERRLPAPNFVGTAMTPDSPDLHTSIRGRLASLSLSGLHNRNVMPWNMEPQAPPGSSTRQPSLQGFPSPTVVLPSVSRGFMNPDTVSATFPHDNGAIGYLFSPSTSAPDLSLPLTSGPPFYGNAALPPLTTAPMLQPLQPLTRYPSISLTSPPLPRIIPDTPRHPSSPDADPYAWTTTTTTTTNSDRRPSVAAAEDENATGSSSSSKRYAALAAVATATTTATAAPLYHPQPQIPHQARSLERLAREAPPPVAPAVLPSLSSSSKESPRGGKKADRRGSRNSLR